MDYSEIDDRLNKIESAIAEIGQFMAAFNIDKQLIVKKDKDAHSGRGTKVTTNADGVVIGLEDLTPSDIPQLSMSKITGLTEALDSKVARSNLDIVNTRIDNIFKTTKTVKTGSKVNVDEHGLVVNVVPLLEEDIPNLSIGKIDGLSERMTVLENNISKKEVPPVQMISEPFKPLEESDLPETLLMKIKYLQDTVATAVSMEQFEQLRHEVSSKSDSTTSTPGTYTKVTINELGQVVDHSSLEKSDLPELTIQDISGLETHVKNSVQISDFNALKSIVDSIESRMTTVAELISIREQIDRFLNNGTIPTIQTQLNELDGKVSNMLYDDTFSKEIDTIKRQLNELSSRISKLEN